MLVVVVVVVVGTLKISNFVVNIESPNVSLTVCVRVELSALFDRCRTLEAP